jgi:hypothetical protein
LCAIQTLTIDAIARSIAEEENVTIGETMIQKGTLLDDASDIFS